MSDSGDKMVLAMVLAMRKALKADDGLTQEHVIAALGVLCGSTLAALHPGDPERQAERMGHIARVALEHDKAMRRIDTERLMARLGIDMPKDDGKAGR